jgi:hypothetical protein
MLAHIPLPYDPSTYRPTATAQAARQGDSIIQTLADKRKLEAGSWNRESNLERQHNGAHHRPEQNAQQLVGKLGVEVTCQTLW